MRTLPARYDPERVQSEAQSFWAARALPTPGDGLGPSGGPPVLQIVSPLDGGTGAVASLQRTVRADATARRLAVAGSRVSTPLLVRASAAPTGQTSIALEPSGVWIGHGRPKSAVELADPSRIAPLVSALARAGLLLAREEPMRACPSCRTPRSPQTIIYAERDSPAFLVRFPLEGELAPASLLLWADATWKLLASAAVAVHPKQLYARVRVRRRGAEETVLVSRSAVPRLAEWLEGAEVESLDERPGSALVGVRYRHPLETEFPALASLPAPAGTVVASEAVVDVGTGVVPLVPCHGPVDHAVARGLGISGWPVLDPSGEVLGGLTHKYAGLTLENAEAFILRDLAESDRLFLQVRAPRGIPFCALCGSELLWAVGRAWCLDLARLPSDVADLLRRLLPPDGGLATDPVVPWPVTDWSTGTDPTLPELSECPDCGRVAPGPAAPRCACGAVPKMVRRPLLPAISEALAQVAAVAPIPPSCAVRLYVPVRNRGPTVVHAIVALAAAGARLGDVRVALLPTLPEEAEPDAWRAAPADAVRATLLRLTASPNGGAAGVAERRREEIRRLRKFWECCRQTLDAMSRDRYEADPGSIASRLGELAEEDRALLSRFERMRREVLHQYDVDEPAAAHAVLWAFFESELRGRYLPIVRARLAADGLTATKRAAYRLLEHVLPVWAELYGPIAPHTMEVIHRAFRGDRESLFERESPPLPDSVLDASVEAAFDRWESVALALRSYRHELGAPADRAFPSVVLYVRDDAVATELRNASAVVARLARVDQVEVASPGRPWDGKRVEARPVPAEIQRAYPAQAGRIVHILEGMNGRRVQEALRANALQVALEGNAVQILPTMVEFSESLPTGVTAVPWALGELYVRQTEGALGREARSMPALTSDGFRFLRAVRKRIDASVAPSAIDRLVVDARGALADELRKHAAALSEYFEGRSFDVVHDADSFVASETIHGRSGRGEPWVVWAPGLAVRPRPTPRPPAPRAPRSRTVRIATPEATEDDFLSDAVRARDTAIRESVESFDRELGRPLMAPAKLAAAWQAGLRSFDDIARAPYERLVVLPGFGPALAETIVRHFGGAVPPPRLRASVVLAPAASEPRSTIEDAASPSAVEIASSPLEPPGTMAAASGRPSEPSRPPAPVLQLGPEVLPTSPHLAGPVVAPPAETPPPAAPTEVAAAAQPAASLSVENLGASEPPVETGLAPDGGDQLATPAPLDRAGVRPTPPPLDETEAPPSSTSPSLPMEEPRRASPEPESGGAATACDPLASPPVSVLPAAVPDSPVPISSGPVVTPSAPAPTVPPTVPPTVTRLPDVGPPVGPAPGVEIWSGPSTDAPWGAFLEATGAGHRGVCVSREFPDRLRAYLGSRDVEVLWLSNVGRERALRPADLDGLLEVLRRHLADRSVTAIYLEGIEYLVRIHGIDRTRRFLDELQSELRVRDARAWVPMNPALIDPSGAAALETAYRIRSPA